LSQLLVLSGQVLFPLDLIELQIGFETIQLLFVFDLIKSLLSLVDLLLLLGLIQVRPLLFNLIQLLLCSIQLLVALQLVQLLALARLIDFSLLPRLCLLLPELLNLVSGCADRCREQHKVEACGENSQHDWLEHSHGLSLSKGSQERLRNSIPVSENRYASSFQTSEAASLRQPAEIRHM
jgi:hypothetical protein